MAAAVEEPKTNTKGPVAKQPDSGNGAAAPVGKLFWQDALFNRPMPADVSGPPSDDSQAEGAASPSPTPPPVVATPPPPVATPPPPVSTPTPTPSPTPSPTPRPVVVPSPTPTPTPGQPPAVQADVARVDAQGNVTHVRQGEQPDTTPSATPAATPQPTVPPRVPESEKADVARVDADGNITYVKQGTLAPAQAQKLPPPADVARLDANGNVIYVKAQAPLPDVYNQFPTAGAQVAAAPIDANTLAAGSGAEPQMDLGQTTAGFQPTGQTVQAPTTTLAPVDFGHDAVSNTAAQVATSQRIDVDPSNPQAPIAPTKVRQIIDTNVSPWQLNLSGQISNDSLKAILDQQAKEATPANVGDALNLTKNYGGNFFGQLWKDVTTTDGWLHGLETAKNLIVGAKDLGADALTMGRNIISPVVGPESSQIIAPAPPELSTPTGSIPQAAEFQPGGRETTAPDLPAYVSPEMQQRQADLQKAQRDWLGALESGARSLRGGAQNILQGSIDAQDTINRWLGNGLDKDEKVVNLGVGSEPGLLLRGDWSQLSDQEKNDYIAARKAQYANDTKASLGDSDSIDTVIKYLDGEPPMTPLELAAYNAKPSPEAIGLGSLLAQAAVLHGIGGVGPIDWAAEKGSNAILSGIRIPTWTASLGLKGLSAAASNEKVVGGLNVLYNVLHKVGEATQTGVPIINWFDHPYWNYKVGAGMARSGLISKGIDLAAWPINVVDRVLATAIDESNNGKPFFDTWLKGVDPEKLPAWLKPPTMGGSMKEAPWQYRIPAATIAGGLKAGIQGAVIAPAMTDNPEDAARMAEQMMTLGAVGGTAKGLRVGVQSPWDHIGTPKYDPILNWWPESHADWIDYNTDKGADAHSKDVMSMPDVAQDVRDKFNDIKEMAQKRWQVYAANDPTYNNVIDSHTNANLSRIDQDVANLKVQMDTASPDQKAQFQSRIDSLLSRRMGEENARNLGKTTNGVYFTNGITGDGPLQVFIRAKDMANTMSHEGWGHPFWEQMKNLYPERAADFLSAAKQTSNMDLFTSDYARRLSNGLVTDLSYDSLPADDASLEEYRMSQEKRRAMRAVSTPDAMQALGESMEPDLRLGLTKEKLDNELAAEHAAMLMDGSRVDQWTKKPSLQRSFILGAGSVLEKMFGIPLTSEYVQSNFAGFNPSIKGFAVMDQAARAMSRDPNTIRPWKPDDLNPKQKPPPRQPTGSTGGPATGGPATPPAPSGPPPGGQPPPARSFSDTGGAWKPFPENIKGSVEKGVVGYKPEGSDTHTAMPEGVDGAWNPHENRFEYKTAPTVGEAGVDETAVKGLIKRGFTREQAVDALKKATVTPTGATGRTQGATDPVSRVKRNLMTTENWTQEQADKYVPSDAKTVQEAFQQAYQARKAAEAGKPAPSGTETKPSAGGPEAKTEGTPPPEQPPPEPKKGPTSTEEPPPESEGPAAEGAEPKKPSGGGAQGGPPPIAPVTKGTTPQLSTQTPTQPPVPGAVTAPLPPGQSEPKKPEEGPEHAGKLEEGGAPEETKPEETTASPQEQKAPPAAEQKAPPSHPGKGRKAPRPGVEAPAKQTTQTGRTLIQPADAQRYMLSSIPSTDTKSIAGVKKMFQKGKLQTEKDGTVWWAEPDGTRTQVGTEAQIRGSMPKQQGAKPAAEQTTQPAEAGTQQRGPIQPGTPRPALQGHGNNIGAFGYPGDSGWDDASGRGVGAGAHVQKPGSMIEGYSAGLTREGARLRGLHPDSKGRPSGEEFVGEDGKTYRWDDTAPDNAFGHKVPDNYVDVYLPHHAPDSGVSAERIARNQAYMDSFGITGGGEKAPPLQPSKETVKAPEAPEAPAAVRAPSPPPAKETEPAKREFTQENVDNALQRAQQSVSPEQFKSAEAHRDAVMKQAMADMGAEHSESLAPGDTRVALNPDTGMISGTHFVSDDPYHQFLLRDLPPNQVPVLNQVQDAIAARRDLYVNYGSAPTGAAPTGTTPSTGAVPSTGAAVAPSVPTGIGEPPALPTAAERETAQAASPAAEREKGLADIQQAGKNVLPNYVAVAPGTKGEPNRVYWGGVSPDKIASNAQQIAAKEGEASPYTPDSVQGRAAHVDLGDYLYNTGNGFKGTGEGPLTPVAGGERLAQTAPDFNPRPLPQDKADFWNLAISGKGTKLGKAEKGGELTQSGKAQRLATENQGFLSPEGHVNRLAAKIDAADPGWINNTLHSGYERLSLGNTKAIHPASEQLPEKIHPGHETVSRAVSETGYPVGTTPIIKAGFMPGGERAPAVTGERGLVVPVVPTGEKDHEGEQLRGITPENIRAKTPEPESGRVEGIRGQEGRRDGSADLDQASQAELLDRISREGSAVKSIATEEGHHLPPITQNPDFSGHEHNVWLEPDGKTLTKETHSWRYGSTPMNADPTGKYGTRYGTPSEYLERQALNNALFGSNVKVQGITALPSGEIRIRTQQAARDYTSQPSLEQIHKFMTERGFIADPENPGLYRNPTNNVIAGDALPKNFVMEKGEIHPLDLQLRRAAPLAEASTSAESPDFSETRRTLFSPEHQDAKDFANRVEDAVHSLGYKKGEVHDAFGGNGNGAENAVVTRTEDTPLQTMKLKTALKVLHGGQTQGIAFAEHPAGDHVLYTLKFDRPAHEVRDTMLAHGLTNHTILADSPHGEETIAHVLDTGHAEPALNSLAEAPKSETGLTSAELVHGHGESVGDPQGLSREVAASNSRRVIEEGLRQIGRIKAGKGDGNLRDLAAEAEQNHQAHAEGEKPANNGPADEILKNPEDKLHYKVGLAIASNGQEGADHTALANHVYQFYQDHGRFPSTKKEMTVNGDGQKTVLGGEKLKAMLDSFKDVNNLEDEHGPEGLEKFLNHPIAAKDLEDRGFHVEGNPKDIRGAWALGPKIGKFFADLNDRTLGQYLNVPQRTLSLAA